nr:hypothetical protein [Tanacetum cinerariifolium]
MLSSAGINLSISASRSQPSGNTKKDKFQQTPNRTKKNKIEAHPRTVRSSLRNKNCVVEPKDTASVQNSKLNVNSDIQYLEVAFRQHACFIRNLKGVDLLPQRLSPGHGTDESKKKSHKPKSEDTNEEKLYLLYMDLCGPMRAKSVNGKKYILVIVDDYSRFTWVKWLRSKDEAPDFIIKFLRMIQQNGVVERRNHTLIEAARTMLIYARAPLFLWADAVTTACYTQNRSIIRLRHGKTPYELLHDKILDLSFFYVFESIPELQPTYQTNHQTIHVDFDELTAMASEQSSSGPALHEMTHATISLGLVPNPTSSTPFVPPSRINWDMLFQSVFDELLTPPPSVDYLAPEVIAPIAKVVALEPDASTGSHSSTTVDQDVPSLSNSQTTPKPQSSIIPNDIEDGNHDLDVAHMNNDMFFDILIPEISSGQSSSTDSIHTIVHPDW